MKYIVFAIAAVTVVPFGAIAAYLNKWAAKVLFALVVLGPLSRVTINFMSHEWYRGDTKGIEFAFTDLAAWALLLGMAMSPRFPKLKLFPPNALPFFLFLLITLFSFSEAYVPLYSFFTLFRLIRAYIVFITIYNFIIADRKHLDFAIQLFVLALLIQTGQVLKQKYLWGMYRTTGTFPHPNTLAMYCEMMIPMVLAWFLAFRPRYSILYWIAIFGGMIAVAGTFSRGGIFIMGGSVVMTVGLSILLKPTGRKVMIIGIFTLVAILGVAKAADSIIERFERAPKASGESRNHFNEAAMAMANEHTFGVGLNNYSYALRYTEYAKYIDYVEEEAGICHHIYNLTAGETGWIGLATFLVFLFGFYIRAFILAIHRRDQTLAVFGIGALGSLSALYLHGLLEWAWRQPPIMGLFFAIGAISVGALTLARDSKHVKITLPRLIPVDQPIFKPLPVPAVASIGWIASPDPEIMTRIRFELDEGEKRRKARVSKQIRIAREKAAIQVRKAAEAERIAQLKKEKLEREEALVKQRREQITRLSAKRSEAERLRVGIVQKREERERTARQDAEKQHIKDAERKVLEEIQRLALEKEERLAREEAERLAQEESERLAREEEERLAREEAERLAQEEEERMAREEAERLAQEEAKRLAREEEERLARQEAERLAREEEERYKHEKAKQARKEDLARQLAIKVQAAREQLEAERLRRKEQINEMTLISESVEKAKQLREHLHQQQKAILAEKREALKRRKEKLELRGRLLEARRKRDELKRGKKISE